MARRQIFNKVLWIECLADAISKSEYRFTYLEYFWNTYSKLTWGIFDSLPSSPEKKNLLNSLTVEERDINLRLELYLRHVNYDGVNHHLNTINRYREVKQSNLVYNALVTVSETNTTQLLPVMAGFLFNYYLPRLFNENSQEDIVKAFYTSEGLRLQLDDILSRIEEGQESMDDINTTIVDDIALDIIHSGERKYLLNTVATRLGLTNVQLSHHLQKYYDEYDFDDENKRQPYLQLLALLTSKQAGAHAFNYPTTPEWVSGYMASPNTSTSKISIDLNAEFKNPQGIVKIIFQKLLTKISADGAQFETLRMWSVDNKFNTDECMITTIETIVPEEIFPPGLDALILSYYE